MVYGEYGGLVGGCLDSSGVKACHVFKIERF
jgi:hypothetical protein